MIKRILITVLCFLPLLNVLYGQEAEQDVMYGARESLANELFPENDPVILRYKEAFLNVKRENYLDSDYRSMAYRNMPLPLGGGTVHPSPGMIADIVRESGIQKDSRVLVVGRNSAYLNAIISQLSDNLFVADPLVRIIQEMDYKAKNDLSYFSWVEEGPFDTIILFGSVREIPQSLVSQLALNGRIILPLEGLKGNQILIKAFRYENGFSLKSIGESYIHSLSVAN